MLPSCINVSKYIRNEGWPQLMIVGAWGRIVEYSASDEIIVMESYLGMVLILHLATKSSIGMAYVPTCR